MATAYVTALFTESGSPKAGLSPTVDILRVSDNTIVVTAGAMTSTAITGVYSYTFAAYDPTETYVALADGTADLFGAERYKHGDLSAATLDDAVTSRATVAQILAAVLTSTETVDDALSRLIQVTAARMVQLDAGNIPASSAAAAAGTAVIAHGGAAPWTTGTSASVAAIVAGIWGEALPGGFIAGQAGYILAAIAGKVAAAETAIRGIDDRDLSELAGAGWLDTTDTLEKIRDAIDAIGGYGMRGHAVDPGVAP